MPTPTPDIPPTLNPYLFHGLTFDRIEGNEAWTECPSCQRADRKFSVNTESGEYKCFTCDFHGGHYTFLRWLFEESDKVTTARVAESFQKDRGLLEIETLTYWSCAISILSRAWIIAAYNQEGALVQLYKRIKTPDKWELRPTKDAGGHAMHGIPLFNHQCSTVYVCEGPWDAMALWEALRMARSTEYGLEHTNNPQTSLLSTSSVLAVANCGAVGESLKKYAPFFQGRRVVLCFDNDHNREIDGRVIEGAGLGASKRLATMLQGVASEVWWLNWQQRPDGWDVRDTLVKGL